ncbi:MAG TPA: hypothetical protein VFU37_19305 [Pyrinomonadaceae bacterium]|nr:hypothetical protein [Pyrinomonadaceae bacterium]
MSLALAPLAFSGGIDEGEFSQAMLGYKLQLLKQQFERAERELSTPIAAGKTLKKLEQVDKDLKYLEAEFRSGRYYPDQLDEEIVIVREELRLILADPGERAPL